MKDGESGFIEWLGFRRKPDWRKARWLGGLFGCLVFFALLLLFLVSIATVMLFAGILFGFIDPGPGSLPHEAIRNIGLVVAAFMGAPFVVWRTVVADRQARIADESLFNDKLSAAAEGLGARRQVTERVGEGERQQVLTEWQDDLVARAVAIDRLEGLVHERPAIAPRVARMLSVYVRELSKEHRPRTFPGPVGDWDALKKWAQGLKPVRSDMERAVQTLGRLKRIPGVDPATVQIDLRGANLQGFDLGHLCFDGTDFREAHMEGVDLHGASLKRADLMGAHLEGAELSFAYMERSVLHRTCFDGATMRAIRLEGADLRNAHLKGAELLSGQLTEANMRGAYLQKADISGANLTGADLRKAHMEDSNLTNSYLEGAVLDNAYLEKAKLNHARARKVSLSDAHLEGADLWHAKLEDATLFRSHMERAILMDADLDGALLQGTYLEGTNLHSASLRGALLASIHISPATNFSNADLTCAGFWDVDCSSTEITQEQVDMVFGDASVTLPDRINRPPHWTHERLNAPRSWWRGPFFDAWRKWQKERGCLPED